jgi:hypothetical protein
VDLVTKVSTGKCQYVPGYACRPRAAATESRPTTVAGKELVPEWSSDRHRRTLWVYLSDHILRQTDSISTNIAGKIAELVKTPPKWGVGGLSLWQSQSRMPGTALKLRVSEKMAVCKSSVRV